MNCVFLKNFFFNVEKDANLGTGIWDTKDNISAPPLLDALWMLRPHITTFVHSMKTSLLQLT